MRVLHFSAVHLNVSPWQLPLQCPTFDVVVVAGELITRAERCVKWLLENVPDKPAAYVLGNHEAYGEDIDRTLEKARQFAHRTNVDVLENDFVEIDGATMWTDFALFGPDRVAICMEAARNGMNDFRRIRKDNYARRFQPEDALARHEATVAFLRWRASQAPDRCRVIVTHHRPVRTASSDDPIEAAYSGSLDELILQLGARVWISGHVHESDDRMVGPTRLVSNPKGYGPFAGRDYGLRHNCNFDPLLTIDVSASAFDLNRKERNTPMNQHYRPDHLASSSLHLQDIDRCAPLNFVRSPRSPSPVPNATLRFR